MVTGAGLGIGRAVAIRLAKEGLNVAINCQDALSAHAEGRETQSLALRASLSGESTRQIVLVEADISNELAVVEMFKALERTFGGIDILINNAGIQIPSDSHLAKTEDYDRVMSVNLRGAFFCARSAIQQFLKHAIKGSIINISSVHEIIPKPKYLGYSISKAGLGNMTKTLAAEYASRGIRVNGVAPGAILTPMNQVLVDDLGKRRMVEQHIPMGRMGYAEEVASAVWFLVSDEASYITGQTLYVDGGLTLYPEFIRPWSSGQE